MRVVVVGSGFSGSILARVARHLGYEVLLVERGRHPRFAIGESSTPLSAIALERLAQQYRMSDLRDLAAYGRWLERMAPVRRGLKRGFTFYRHEVGSPYRNHQHNDARLLVAASPNDEVADSHWLRADVDHFLVKRAVAEGVEYWDETTLEAIERHGSAFQLAGHRAGRRHRWSADFVFDASGPDGFLAQQLGIAPAMPSDALSTGLIYGHFSGVRPLETVTDGAVLPPGPYADSRAAVHHMVHEGWMYELPFDHGVVSAGFVVEARGRDARALLMQPPEQGFTTLLNRYPTLRDQYAEAEPVRPIACIPRLQRRLERAAGDGWALLPHAYMFWSPLYSTGIAWSLLGVERLGLVLANGGDARLLARYGRLLATEADHIRALVELAYRSRGDFDAFDACAQLYFVAASYCEARQRLCPAPSEADREWAWTGFLGATDPHLQSMVPQISELAQEGDTRMADLARVLAPRNVAGMADPERRRLYPVQLDTLVTHAAVLGHTKEGVRAALPRLRGWV